MALAGDLLKEFLIGIAIAVDEQGLRKLDKVTKDSEKAAKTLDDQARKLEREEQDRLKRRTEHHERFSRSIVAQGVLIADAIEAAAKAVANATAGIADGLSKALHAADRTKSTVAGLQALEFAFGKIGLASGTATATVEGFEQRLRNNPGLRSFVQGLGVATRGAEGLVDTIAAIQKKYGGDKNYHVGSIYAGMLGIDEQTFNEISRKLPQIQEYQAEQRKTAALLGLNYEDAAKKSDAFMKSLYSLGAFITTAAQKLLSELTPALKGVIDEFLRWVQSHPEQVQEALRNITDAIKALGEGLRTLVTDGLGNLDKFAESFKDWNKEGGVIPTIKTLVEWVGSLVKALQDFSDFTGSTSTSILRFLGIEPGSFRPGVSGGGAPGGLGVGAIGGGGPLVGGGGGGGGGGASPADTRKWYEKILPKAMGGKDAPSGGSGAPGVPALAVGKGTGAGHVATDAERAAYIREAAKRNGIDPDTALRVAQSEGFAKYSGDSNTSFGDFQLHYGGSGIKGLNSAGMGDDFTKATGLDARDPSTWKQQIDFAMKNAAKGGWKPWHGAARVGIGNWQGIGGAAPGDAVAGGPSGIEDISGTARFRGGQRSSTDGFIFHHTAGGGTAAGVVNTLNQRGLGVHYVMGRDGKIYQTLPDGAKGAHMMPASRFPGAVDPSLNNNNTMGMEVIAKDDRDVTPAQVAAAKQFMSQIRKQYPGIKVYGHGEENPGHKQATEGLTIANAVRAMKDEGAAGGQTPVDWSAVRKGMNGIDFSRANMTPRPLGSTSSENGSSSSSTLSQSNSTKIEVSGAGDPHAVAAAVAARQEGVNRMSLRNAQSAMR